MLLDLREKMLRRIALGEDDGLAEQRADLGASDVEHVGDAGEVRQRHVGAGGGQSVAESCAVHEQRHAVPVGGLGDGLKLGLAVDRAVLGGVRDVDQSGEHHVLVVVVGIEGGAIVVELGGIELARVMGERDHLVAGRLDGAGLVHVRMAGINGDDALVRGEHGVDHGLVGLRAADEEPHVGVGRLACFADPALGIFAGRVAAVSGERRVVGPRETVEDLGAGPIGIIVSERQHVGSLSRCVVVRMHQGM